MIHTSRRADLSSLLLLYYTLYSYMWTIMCTWFNWSRCNPGNCMKLVMPTAIMLSRVSMCQVIPHPQSLYYRVLVMIGCSLLDFSSHYRSVKMWIQMWISNFVGMFGISNLDAKFIHALYNLVGMLVFPRSRSLLFPQSQ
jgi:hypothetical protein